MQYQYQQQENELINNNGLFYHIYTKYQFDS